MSEQHSAGSIGRSAFWSILNQMTGQFLSLLVFLITARFVSKEDFGIMATCMLAVELFRQFLIESLGTTIYSRKSPTDQDYTAGFFIIAVCGITAGTIVFLFAGPIADLFDHDSIESSLRWIAFLLFALGLSKMHEIWLTKHLQFRTLALRSMLSILVGGAVGITMAINGFGIAALIAQQLVTAIISVIWLWAATPWRPSFRPQWDSIKSIFHAWKYLAMNSLTALVSGQSDVFFASYYLGPAATGVYNAGKRIIGAVSMIMGGGINSVALPALTSFAHDRAKFQSAFLTGISVTALFTAPLYAGLIVLSPDLVHILLGDKWADVAPILSILGLIYFITSIQTFSVNVILIEEKAHWQAALSLISAITNVLFLFILARHGLHMLAFAMLLRVLLYAPTLSFVALRLIKVPALSYIRRLVLPVAISFVMGCGIFMTRDYLDLPAWANIGLLAPLGGGLYIIVFFIMDRMTILNAWTMIQSTVKKDKST